MSKGFLEVCPKEGECIGCKARSRAENPDVIERSFARWLEWYVGAFSTTVLASRDVCPLHEVEVAAALVKWGDA